jgi:hypothetical protein
MGVAILSTFSELKEVSKDAASEVTAAHLRDSSSDLLQF